VFVDVVVVGDVIVDVDVVVVVVENGDVVGDEHTRHRCAGNAGTTSLDQTRLA